MSWTVHGERLGGGSFPHSQNCRLVRSSNEERSGSVGYDTFIQLLNALLLIGSSLLLIPTNLAFAVLRARHRICYNQKFENSNQICFTFMNICSKIKLGSVTGRTTLSGGTLIPQPLLLMAKGSKYNSEGGCLVRSDLHRLVWRYLVTWYVMIFSIFEWHKNHLPWSWQLFALQIDLLPRVIYVAGLYNLILSLTLQPLPLNLVMVMVAPH